MHSQKNHHDQQEGDGDDSAPSDAALATGKTAGCSRLKENESIDKDN